MLRDQREYKVVLAAANSRKTTVTSNATNQAIALSPAIDDLDRIIIPLATGRRTVAAAPRHDCNEAAVSGEPRSRGQANALQHLGEVREGIKEGDKRCQEPEKG
jgi:hypothetical protein